MRFCKKKVWCNLGNIGEVNKTNIFLIPKVDHPQSISQSRPISLCNIIYNIISKVVVERLKSCMDKLVPPFQTEFVPGRPIHENIIIAK